MSKAKNKPLKIDISEDAALRAFLKMLPPSKLSAEEDAWLRGERKKPKNKKKTAKKKPR